MYGSETYNAPSRFLREIPRELLEEVRLGGQVSRQPSSVSHGSSNGAKSSDGYQLGMRVLHPKFGEGTIIHFEGQGPNARLQINFDRAGSKWLVSQYARLEPV